ncbi:MAG TPA: hypothetical protein EYG86_00015 [Crocinitomicaceae bacterium]|nr:hypothetical protein [Crocinitomicaceae bacterium]
MNIKKNNSISSDLFLQNIKSLANYYSATIFNTMDEVRKRKSTSREVTEFLKENQLDNNEESKEVSALKLVNALEVAHQKFTNVLIPKIEQYFLLLVDCFPEDKMITALFNLFVKFQGDFHEHLDVEEKNVFPYIRKIHFVVKNKSKRGARLIRDDNYSIASFAHSHDNTELYLTEIISLLENIKSMEKHPARNILLKHLVRMDEQIKVHANIEDSILIEKVLELEIEIDQIIKK